jgi:hypothetical protein
MSEIPKLKLCESVFVENIGNKDEINFVVNNHNKEDIITLSNLKEVNDFYDKYKDRYLLFFNDYPEYINIFENYLKILDTPLNLESWIIRCLIVEEFKNWLHDLLYKVE